MDKTSTMSFEFIKPMLSDRLHELAKEYSVSTDVFICIALQKFISEIDMLRDMRVGKIKLD